MSENFVWIHSCFSGLVLSVSVAWLHFNWGSSCHVVWCSMYHSDLRLVDSSVVLRASEKALWEHIVYLLSVCCGLFLCDLPFQHSMFLFRNDTLARESMYIACCQLSAKIRSSFPYALWATTVYSLLLSLLGVVLHFAVVMAIIICSLFAPSELIFLLLMMCFMLFCPNACPLIVVKVVFAASLSANSSFFLDFVVSDSCDLFLQVSHQF